MTKFLLLMVGMGYQPCAPLDVGLYLKPEPQFYYKEMFDTSSECLGAIRDWRQMERLDKKYHPDRELHDFICIELDMDHLTVKNALVDAAP